RRPGADDPHPGPHDRDDQQADSHLARAGPGARPRADLGRDRAADGHPGVQGPQGAQDRAGADLARDPDRRGGGFASWRLHRRPPGGVAVRRGDQPEPQGADRPGPEDADAARREGDQDALRGRRRLRAHARGSRPELRRHPRAHPPDRGEGAAQAAPPVAFAQAEGVPRRTDVGSKDTKDVEGYEGAKGRRHLLPFVMWWAHQDSNLERAGYEPAALTVELWARTDLTPVPF